MNECQLQKVYKYRLYPRDSKLFSDRGFVIIDNGSQGGTHWTAFYVKNVKSFYFDSFGGQLDKFLLNQLSKPIVYLKYKTQNSLSKLCGSYYLYFFYLFEFLNYYDAILIHVFELNYIYLQLQ